jgi:hypothetical protein
MHAVAVGKTVVQGIAAVNYGGYIDGFSVFPGSTAKIHHIEVAGARVFYMAVDPDLFIGQYAFYGLVAAQFLQPNLYIAGLFGIAFMPDIEDKRLEVIVLAANLGA